MRAKTKQEELHEEASEMEHPYDLSEVPAKPDLQEQVRQRAYELSQQRGDADGDELSDWYQAEAEIRAAFGPSEFNDVLEDEDDGEEYLAAHAR